MHVESWLQLLSTQRYTRYNRVFPCTGFPAPSGSQVEQKLQLVQQGKWVDPRPEYERSPSPEPVYNESGARVNTREWRQKEALTKKRTVRA